MSNTVTIFNGAKETLEAHYITVNQALKRIKNGKSKEAVGEIRKRYAEKEKYDHLKIALPSVIFAGVADKVGKDSHGRDTLRNDECITKHSGFFVLDFDEGDTEVLKQRLQKDTYIYAVWAGVTKGCKALVKCPPNIVNHPLYYNAFLSRYPELDTTSKNIGRLCFESYDSDLWVNEKSLVWDKTLTDEEYQKQKQNLKDRKKKRLMDISASMIRGSRDGEKHETLLRASTLLGGGIKPKTVSREEATEHLETEIKKKHPKDFKQAQKTIQDGLTYGMNAPLHEIKEIEKSLDFTRRSDGSYDFLASDEEMDDYETAVINGSLEMGMITGMPKLDEHWMFKKNTLVWLAARDNVGKSFVFWYFSVLAAMQHDWKVLMYAKENRDGSVRKKIKEFYIGKSIKLFNDTDHKLAKEFIQNNFKFFTAKRMHTAEDWLMKCEIVYDEGFEYDVVIGDPYNAFDLPIGENQYTVNLRSLNQLQTFKENYSAVWITDHITSTAARGRNSDGGMEVPTKHDVEFGQMKPNKADDFIIAHRNLKGDGNKYVTEIHVDKIKEVETGGCPTPKDEPVMLLANKDLCSFSCNGVDPIKEYWKRKGMYNPPQETEQPKSRLVTQGWNTPQNAPF